MKILKKDLSKTYISLKDIKKEDEVVDTTSFREINRKNDICSYDLRSNPEYCNLIFTFSSNFKDIERHIEIEKEKIHI